MRPSAPSPAPPASTGPLGPITRFPEAPAASSVTSAPPKIAFATQSHHTWRVGNALAHLSRAAAPVGSTFAFALNEAARVSFAVSQWVGGRQVDRKCVAPTATNARRPGCARATAKGTLVFSAHSGTNKIFFDGRISGLRQLQAGRFTVALTAMNAANQRSTPTRLSFVIVK